MTGIRVPAAALAALVAVAVVSGCGSSAPPAGQALAQQACQSSGDRAAALAQQAAKANPRYGQLSTDEQAAAQADAAEESELSDGNASDDSGLGSLVSADGAGSVGTVSGDRILNDCVSLGLAVLKN
jgi:hypothetical protein